MYDLPQWRSTVCQMSVWGEIVTNNPYFALLSIHVYIRELVCKGAVFVDTWLLSILGISPTLTVTVDWIMTTSFPLWQLPSFSPFSSCLYDLPFICLPKANCFWSCYKNYLKKAHYDPLSPQSFVFPPCACCQPGKLQTLQLCRVYDLSLPHVHLMCS